MPESREYNIMHKKLVQSWFRHESNFSTCDSDCLMEGLQ